MNKLGWGKEACGGYVWLLSAQKGSREMERSGSLSDLVKLASMLLVLRTHWRAAFLPVLLRTQ